MNTFKLLQKELNRVYKSGKITKLVDLPNNTGVDVLLDLKISVDQAENISRYLNKNYNVSAIFYRKNHVIKVLYKNDI